MDDLLNPWLQRLELRSRVFHAGNLCSLANFDAADGVGHLHVLKAGQLQVRTSDGLRRTFDEPSLIFFPQAGAHSLMAPQPEGADLVCASVEFGASLATSMVHGLPSIMAMPLGEIPAITGVLDALFAEAFHGGKGREVALNRLSEVVLIFMLRHAIAHGDLNGGVLAGLADTRLAKALKAIHAEPARAWTLQDLASLAGMSRARFAAHFAEVVGQPAIEYLAGWRLSVAQGLLAQGRQVKSIADEVGYGSPNALARAFSQRLGLSPTDWLAQRHRAPA